MIKAAIFDFNGTLFWDTPFHSQAFDVFTERYLKGVDGLQSRPLTVEDKRDHIMGKPNDLIMEFIFGRKLTAEEVMRLGEEKEAIYRDLCRGKVQFAPGAEELFSVLRNADIPFAVASSAEIANINFYYEQMPLERWFARDKVIYNDNTFRGKPAPDIFLRAAHRLNVKAEQTVIFEDSLSGVQAAEAAHAQQIIVVKSEPSNFVASLSKYPVIDDFRQAIDILRLQALSH